MKSRFSLVLLSLAFGLLCLVSFTGSAVAAPVPFPKPKPSAFTLQLRLSLRQAEKTVAELEETMKRLERQARPGDLQDWKKKRDFHKRMVWELAEELRRNLQKDGLAP